MKDHWVKFALLAAVVAAVFFSRAAYLPPTGGAAGKNAPSDVVAAANEVPLFSLPPVAVQAAGGSLGAANSSTTAAASGEGIVVAAGFTPPPALHDAASLVMDLASGDVAEATNANRRWPTASLAKLMSATIILDEIPTSTAITVTEEMFSVDPSEFHLVVGGRYTVEDLLHAMLMPSSNVAAQAAADFYGLRAFLAAMNARAAAWGMADTHFDDPSGISAGDQSTARDLAKLAAVIYARYPQILQISDTQYYSITDLATGRKVLLRSINAFAGQPQFIGGKTGNTPQADENLLSVFRYRGQPILVVVLGTDHWFGDTQALYNWFKANAPSS